MNKQIDDLMILGFGFTEQQLEVLGAAVDIALSAFENNDADPNMALTNRLNTIRERIDYMVEPKQAYKHGDKNR